MSFEWHCWINHLGESKYDLTLNKLIQKVFQRFSLLSDVLNNILKIEENRTTGT